MSWVISAHTRRPGGPATPFAEGDFKPTHPKGRLHSNGGGAERRGVFVRSLAALIAVVWAALAFATPVSKPNILFIAVDDLNDWVIGGRAGIRVPNLDRLMARGVTFTNAHCASPSCHPSRLAVMTGVRPSTSGIDHNVYSQAHASWRTGPYSGTGALANAVVLSRHFRHHGWRATGSGKIFHGLQWVDGSENEPDAWDEFFPSALDQMPLQVRPGDLVEDAAAGIVGARPIGGGTGRRGQVFGAHALKVADEKMSDAQVADWAIAQLKSPPRDQPLFLAVGLFRPHMPWEVPEKYFDLYPLAGIERPKILGGDLDDTHRHDRVSWHAWVLANEEKFAMWERLIQGYQASITFMDAQLGRVLAALDASPLAKNTIVVLWSDHGMHFGEKENWEKFTLWERSTRVPLIIAGPGIVWPGTRVTSPASLIDIYPTLCELTGTPVPPQCEGMSLVPQLRDPNAARTVPAITTQTQGRQSGHAVRDDRWRYIRYFDAFEELYDHAADPDEFRNLANDPKFAAEKARLRGWLEKVKAPLDGKYSGVAEKASNKSAPK
jgi:arylsulfatase A-like enzyme